MYTYMLIILHTVMEINNTATCYWPWRDTVRQPSSSHRGNCCKILWYRFGIYYLTLNYVQNKNVFTNVLLEAVVSEHSHKW